MFSFPYLSRNCFMKFLFVETLILCAKTAVGLLIPDLGLGR
jgi:hypothetical protein